LAGYAPHVGEVETCLYLSKSLKGRYNVEIIRGREDEFGMYLDGLGVRD